MTSNHPFTIVVDTRETKPWILVDTKGAPWPTQPGTLKTGDYTIVGMEKEVTIERKGLQDFVNCVGGDRERFEKELERMKEYRHRAIIVEASQETICAGNWHGKTYPNSVLGSAESFRQHYNVHLLPAGNAEQAAAACVLMLRIYWNRMYDAVDARRWVLDAGRA